MANIVSNKLTIYKDNRNFEEIYQSILEIIGTETGLFETLAPIPIDDRIAYSDENVGEFTEINKHYWGCSWDVGYDSPNDDKHNRISITDNALELYFETRWNAPIEMLLGLNLSHFMLEYSDCGQELFGRIEYANNGHFQKYTVFKELAEIKQFLQESNL